MTADIPDVFDATRAEQLKTLLGEQYQRIATNFLTNAGTYIDAIGTALKEKDRATASATAHKLKSSSAQFGLLRLQKLSASIEYSEALDDGALAALHGELQPAYDQAKGLLL